MFLVKPTWRSFFAGNLSFTKKKCLEICYRVHCAIFQLIFSLPRTLMLFVNGYVIYGGNHLVPRNQTVCFRMLWGTVNLPALEKAPVQKRFYRQFRYYLTAIFWVRMI
jgi:hypothetical protein